MLRLHVVDQTRFNPETVMPGYYRRAAQLNRVARELEGRTFLTAQEIEDVVAYLATLK
jgi:sulfur-oxidizing protein SoxX